VPGMGTVKEDLSFALEGVYRTPVYVRLPGLPPEWALKSVRYGDRDVTYTATDFAALPPARLEIIVTNRVATPSVKIVNDRGEDVPAAQVLAIPAASERWGRPFWMIPQNPPTGSAAKMRSVVPGDYLFAALTLEDLNLVIRDPSRIASVATIATRVTLAAGETPLLTLRIARLPDR
jgi:hypothetical protein